VTPLARWYRATGRHDLAWRHTRDRWEVLVAEVMLAQTQVARVELAWPAFLTRFPTPQVAAAADPGDLIDAWDRLGYPRRARRLWETAVIVTREGWPDDLTELPGVGRYTAGAVRAEADDDPEAIGIDVNIRRVCERHAGRRLTDAHAVPYATTLAAPLVGRDRLLALMDLGALVCRARRPECSACPLEPTCATRGVRADETRHRQARFEGSFRQRRGRVLARLRAEPSVPAAELDADALASLVADGLAEVSRGRARLPRRSAGSSRAGRDPSS
jgi:A/G-specific adenine glycosylase